MVTVTRYRNVSVTLHTFNTPSTSVEHLLETSPTSSVKATTLFGKYGYPSSEKAVNVIPKAVNVVHSITGKFCHRQILPTAENDISSVMKSAHMGEAHSLSHKALERSLLSACISAKLTGVGSSKSERSTWVN